MNENLKISQNGINLIKESEGIRLEAYQDSVGVWTIGFGHTRGVYPGMTISQSQAEQFLKEDITSHVSGIYRYITIELNQNQFDALASFHYNLGANILAGTTLLAYINSKNFQAAANEMLAYCHANGAVVPGLLIRRRAEADLFLKNTNDQSVLVTIDTMNLNSLYFHISGWLVANVDTNKMTPILLFIDVGNGTELGRVALKKVQRNDVNKVHPNPSGSNVGFVVDGETPEKLLNKKYRLLIRYMTNNTTIGVENTVSTIYESPNQINTGVLDTAKSTNEGNYFSGWHASWNAKKGKYHFLIVIDEVSGRELGRINATANQVKRPDIEKFIGSQILGSGESGFIVQTNQLLNSKGQRGLMISRYTNDPNGNNPVVDFVFSQHFIL